LILRGGKLIFIGRVVKGTHCPSWTIRPVSDLLNAKKLVHHIQWLFIFIQLGTQSATTIPPFLQIAQYVLLLNREQTNVTQYQHFVSVEQIICNLLFMQDIQFTKRSQEQFEGKPTYNTLPATAGIEFLEKESRP
jgi:hypothetical protein